MITYPKARYPISGDHPGNIALGLRSKHPNPCFMPDWEPREQTTGINLGSITRESFTRRYHAHSNLGEPVGVFPSRQAAAATLLALVTAERELR